MASRIERLRIEKSKLLVKVSNIEGEIANIQNNCQHSDFESSEWYKERGLGGGSFYWERLNTCKDCGHLWHEQQQR